MEPWQLLETKHAILNLLTEVLEQASKIDVARYPRVRFAVELNFDVQRGSLTDSGVEVRYRRELKK